MAASGPLIGEIPWVARENRRFIETLRAMDGAAWRRPTFCPGWTAADVVAHMTLGARFYAHVIPAGARGRLEMPFGAPDLESFWAHRKRVGEKLAALPGGERVDVFEEAVGRLQEVFEAIRPGDLDRPAWHWLTPCPIRTFPGQRLYELVLHDWDIRGEPGADLHPGALEAAVDCLPVRFPIFFNARTDRRLEGFFRFETERPARAWGLAVRGGRAGAAAPEADRPDAAIRAGGSDLILLTTGRADLRAKEAAGRIRIEGDRARAEALLGVLSRPF